MAVDIRASVAHGADHLVVAISGQNGFLSAALLIGGLRCLARSPAYGGVLLGLLTYKPQFVLLLPIVLIASRNVSAILAACATALFVAAASSAALDWSIWQHWIAGFSIYQSLLQTNQTGLDHLMPTVVAGVHALGAPVSIGYSAQFLCSGVVGVLTWRACARGIDETSIALAAIGSMVVAPYAMIYDMPMIAAAIALHWKSTCRRRCADPDSGGRVGGKPVRLPSRHDQDFHSIRGFDSGVRAFPGHSGLA